MPPPTSTKQISPVAELGTLSEDIAVDKSNGHIPVSFNEEEELVEKEIRDRFKKMCEGYFDSVSKKLVNEHKVSYNVSARKVCIRPLCFQRLQEQDRRNHEAYIRSGEIFEDRQQAYEKMTKGYEKLLANCQTCVCTPLLHICSSRNRLLD